MEKIYDKNLLDTYFNKANLINIFDSDISKYAEIHFYKKNKFILNPGNELKYYYIVVEGEIKISYLFENGKSMFLKFYKPFFAFGDIELLKDIPVVCNVEAIKDTYLIAIPINIIKKNYLNSINFMKHLSYSLGNKLYSTISNTSYNFVYPLENRVASYLVDKLDNKDFIILDSSFQEISEFLGTTYRHLNRTLKELEKKLIIKYQNKKIIILNREKLINLSKSDFIKS